MIDENKYSVYAWLLIIRGYWMQQQGDKAFQWIIFQKRFVWLLSNPFLKNELYSVAFVVSGKISVLSTSSEEKLTQPTSQRGRLCCDSLKMTGESFLRLFMGILL